MIAPRSSKVWIWAAARALLLAMALAWPGPSRAQTDSVRLTGLHYYVVMNQETRAVVARGTAGSTGVAFDRLILTPNTRYRIWVLQASSLLIGYVDLLSPAAGRTLKLPEIRLGTDLAPDPDADGLSDDGEWVMGTDPANPDSDGDAIADGTEVRQGTDPLSGRAVRTGIIASARVNGTAVDIVAANDMAILACSDRGITVFNIFNGMNPTLIAEVDTPGDARRVALAGNLVAVADRDGVALIDLTDPPAAQVTQYLTVGGPVNAIAASAGLAYAGLSSGQIVVLDLRSGAEAGRVAIGGAVEDLVLAGDYIYAATAGAVHTISVADGDLRPLGSVASPIVATGTRRIGVGGGVLYVVHGKGYNTFSLDEPALPRLIAAGNTRQFGWKQIALNGSGLALGAVDQNFALDGPNDVSIYNVADPVKTDVLVTAFPTPGLARSVAIYNGLGYVADSPAGLQVVNYLAYDNQRRPPQISLRASFPMNPAAAEEGKQAWLEAVVADDVQVRNVELYIDGRKVGTDGNFPFEFRFVTPLRSASKDAFTVRARASDTGGNSAWSQELLVALAQDATPPRVTRMQPAPSAISGSVDSIAVSFSEPLNPSTVVPEAFALSSAGPDGILGSPDDVPVTGWTLAYHEPINGAVLQLPALLGPGNYLASAARPLADRAGNLIAAPVKWRFRVFDRADRDRDGVPDELEAGLGLNADLADSDRDGIADGDEDFDNDGLANSAEILLGTDPRNRDTDGDQIADGSEDSDGDGLLDGLEGRNLTDPLLPDTDGDGWNDETEVTARSNPLDPASRPRLFLCANPAVRLALPDFAAAEGSPRGVVLAQPPVSISVPGLGGAELRVGAVLAGPPVSVALASAAPDAAGAKAVVLAQPPVRIGLAGVGAAGLPFGTTLAKPPVKIETR